MAQPVGNGPAPGLAFDSEPDLLVTPTRRRRKASAGRIITYVFVTLLAGGLMAVGVWYMASILTAPEIDNRAFKTKGNFNMRFPSGGWQRDVEAERQMGLNLALARKDPYAVAGLFYKDYGHRNASNGELFDETMKRLRGYFEGLEYQEPFEKPVKEKLGGEPAVVMDFIGVRDQVLFAGQIHMLTRRGYGYWFFTWAPEQERDLLADKFESVRNCFTLRNNREGWQPRPRDTDTFVGEGLPYQVSFATDIWQKEDNPKDYDTRCELALRGYEPTENEETGRKRTVEYAGKLATAQVLILPAAASLKEANDAALAHLLKRKQEEQPRAALEPVPGKGGKPELDRDTDVGGFRGHLSKIRIFSEADGYERFLLVGVVNQPAGSLVVVCESPWSRRDFWMQEFRSLIDSVRSSGKAQKTTEKAKEKPKDPDSPE